MSDSALDARGKLAVQRLGNLTRELVVAEEDYRTVLREAQDAGAIGATGQTSNFRADWTDDGCSNASLRSTGYPVPPRKRLRLMEGWRCEVGGPQRS